MLVKIQNPSKPGDQNHRVLHLVHQDEVMDIAPGEDVIVDFDVACSFFGHPQARDTARNKDRSDTLQRIMFMWGYQLGGLGAAEQWEEIRPPFRVVTLKDEYMPMVLDDPAGVLPLPGEDAAVPGDTLETATLRAAVAAQQAQIDQLIQLIASREVAANPGVVPDAPVDAPKLNENDAVKDGTLPPAPANEAPVTADAPRTPRSRGTTLQNA